MDSNIRKGFTLLLISVFAIALAACSSPQADTTPEPTVETDNSAPADTSSDDSGSSETAQEAVDNTIEEEFISDDDSEDEVEIGELI